MPITVNRTQLLNTLETVRHGLASRDSIQQATSFVFQRGWIQTFNDEVTCRMKTPLPKDFAGAVPAEKLMEVLRRLPDDEIFLERDGVKLWIKAAGGTKVWLRFEPEILLPVDQVEEPGDWTDLPEGFDDAVKIVCEVAKPNADEFLCKCVHIRPDAMEATDRAQIVRVSLDTGTDEPFLVQQPALKPLAALNMTQVSRTPEWLHFRNESRLYYSCRRHRYDYPDVTPVLKFRGTPTVLPKGAKDATTIAEIFTEEDREGMLNVRLSRGQMLVYIHGQSGGAEKPLNTSYDGDPIEFRITPKLLINIVTKHNECEIGLRPGGPVLRVTGANWIYLTSLGAVGSEDRPEPGKPKAGKGRGKKRSQEEEPEPVMADADEIED